MKILGAVLGGLLIAAAAIAGLDRPLAQRQTDLDAELRRQDKALADLQSVRVQVEAYQEARRRLNTQISWIERERALRKCPWPLPGLPLEGAGLRVDGIVVEGSSLVLLGTADSPTAVEELTRALRGASWAREVQSGAAGPGRSSFGLFARVELPACGGVPGGVKGATP